MRLERRASLALLKALSVEGVGRTP
jgi:hypothetical protein